MLEGRGVGKEGWREEELVRKVGGKSVAWEYFAGSTPMLEPTQINQGCYGISLALIYCRIILRYGS